MLYHFSFKDRVTALDFSPSGRYFAVGLGRLVQIWRTPSILGSSSEDGLEFAPFVLHKVYAGHYDTIQHIGWSSDSRFFISASKDLTSRLWSVGQEQDFLPTTLAGHRESLVAAWFSSDQEFVSPALCPKSEKLLMLSRYTL